MKRFFIFLILILINLHLFAGAMGGNMGGNMGAMGGNMGGNMGGMGGPGIPINNEIWVLFFAGLFFVIYSMKVRKKCN